MPYIPIANEFPGIAGLLNTYTETGSILKQLANTLLNKDTEAFNKAERETVASYISYLNNCQFCYRSHLVISDGLWKQNGKTKEIAFNIEGNWNDQITLVQFDTGVREQVWKKNPPILMSDHMYNMTKHAL